MSHAESNEVSLERREALDAFQARLTHAVEVFQEVFNLLEGYAPVWYTEEHHSRAVAALSSFEESRKDGRAETARSERLTEGLLLRRRGCVRGSKRRRPP